MPSGVGQGSPVRPRRGAASGLCQAISAKSGIIGDAPIVWSMRSRLSRSQNTAPSSRTGAAARVKHVDRTLRLRRIERRADDLPLAGPVVLGAFAAGLDDPRLDLAGNQAVQDAALGFDQAELVPRRFAKRLRSAPRRCRSLRRDRRRSRYGSPSPGSAGCCGRSAARKRRAGHARCCAAGSPRNRRRRRPPRKQAIVVRRMLVSGSFAVIMR